MDVRVQARGSAGTLSAAAAQRSEALAALALPDLPELDQVSCPPGHTLSFSASLETYVRSTAGEQGQLSVSVHRTADHAELLRVPVSSSGNPLPRGRRVLEVACSPRGFPVAVDATEQSIVIGQPPGRLLVATLEVPMTETTYEVGFSAGMLRLHPEGRWLAAAARFATDVVILDLANASEPVARLPHPLSLFSDLDWSPDGRHLAVACGHGNTPCAVQVWAWESGQARAEQLLQGHLAPSFACGSCQTAICFGRTAMMGPRDSGRRTSDANRWPRLWKSPKGT